MNERVMKALVELLEYADYDGGGCEEESYIVCLEKCEHLSSHIVLAMQTLRDYVAGRNVEARFSLGYIYATAGALKAFREAERQTTDWKNSPPETTQ